MFLFAIIFSVIIKNPGGDDDEDDDEEECKIAPKDDEMLHQQDEGKGHFNILVSAKNKITLYHKNISVQNIGW